MQPRQTTCTWSASATKAKRFRTQSFRAADTHCSGRHHGIPCVAGCR
jgi:hypothetical protein